MVLAVGDDGDAVVKLFSEALEVHEVLIGVVLLVIAFRRLVEVVGTRSRRAQQPRHGQCGGQKESIYIFVHSRCAYNVMSIPMLKRRTVG